MTWSTNSNHKGATRDARSIEEHKGVDILLRAFDNKMHPVKL